MSKSTSPKLSIDDNPAAKLKAGGGPLPKPVAKTEVNAARSRTKAKPNTLLWLLLSRTTVRIDVARCLFGIAAIIAALNAAGFFGLLLKKLGAGG